MNQHEVMLAAIGDLEVTRRALIMEIQARDEYIKELEEKLGIVRDEQGAIQSQNGQVVLEEIEAT